jgi:hypothetical protein
MQIKNSYQIVPRPHHHQESIPTIAGNQHNGTLERSVLDDVALRPHQTPLPSLCNTVTTLHPDGKRSWRFNIHDSDIDRRVHGLLQDRSIFSRSAGYAIFVLVTTAIKLLRVRVQMVVDKVRHDSSISLAPSSSISNMYTLSTTTRSVNKVGSRELADVAGVSSGAGFVVRLCNCSKRG